MSTNRIAGAAAIACLLLTIGGLFNPQTLQAGGAWVPGQGKGYIQAGFSSKFADRVWDDNHDELIRTNAEGGKHIHEFHYGYLSGEIGLIDKLSGTFVFTYLWGREGYDNEELEINNGLSDAWIGLKYSLTQGEWPMAVQVVLRTPFFYDQDGPYTRHLYHIGRYRLPDGTTVADTTFLAINNPEWRGLNKHDLTMAFLVSHSMPDLNNAWLNLRAGLTLREGAPADEIPLGFDFGLDVPVGTFRPKLTAGVSAVFSLGNNSTADPNDRFNFPPGSDYDFNDADMVRGHISAILPVFDNLDFEIGYAQWLWGRGARQYKEPFASLALKL